MEEIKVRAAYQDDVSPGIKKTASQVQSSTDNMTSAFEKMGKQIAVAALAVVTFDKIKDALVSSAKAAMDNADTEVRLASVLNATSSASGQTMDSLDRLASSMSDVTTFSKDTVKSAEVLLLTFNKISGKTFPDVIRLAGDMSAIFGTDLNSNVEQLGKVLQSPVDGLMRLRRQGIYFTEEQKNLVQELVNTNRVGEAQGVIMAEVEKRVKGAAEAAALAGSGPWKRMGNVFSETSDAMGSTMLPALNRLATWFVDHKIEIEAIGSTIGEMVARTMRSIEFFIKSFQGLYEGLVEFIQTISATVKSAGDIVVKIFNDMQIAAVETLLSIAKVSKNTEGVEFYQNWIENAKLKNKTFNQIADELKANSSDFAKSTKILLEAYDLFNKISVKEKPPEPKKPKTGGGGGGGLWGPFVQEDFDKWTKASEDLKNIIVTELTDELDIKKQILEIDKQRIENSLKVNQLEQQNTEKQIESYKMVYNLKLATIHDSYTKKKIIDDAEASEEQVKLESALNAGLITREQFESSKDDIILKHAQIRSQMVYDEVNRQTELYGGMAITVTDIFSNLNQAKKNNINEEIAKEKEAVASSNMSAKAKEKANKEIDKKHESELKKASENSKNIAYSQALINGALGITKILADWAWNPPVAAVLTALEMGLVASQLAVIKSQKFALGGDFITNGRQTITVGDNPGGRERVQVTPLSSPNINGPQQAAIIDMSIIVYGNIDSNAAEMINNRRQEQLIEFKSMYRELQYTGQI
jgi:hypothetical protein